MNVPSRNSQLHKGRQAPWVSLAFAPRPQGLAGLSGSSLFLLPLKPEGAEQNSFKLSAGHSEMSGEHRRDSGTVLVCFTDLGMRAGKPRALSEKADTQMPREVTRHGNPHRPFKAPRRNWVRLTGKQEHSTAEHCGGQRRVQNHAHAEARCMLRKVLRRP